MAHYAHPLLGQITGTSHDGVNRFCGIQYATLQNRFANPVVAEGDPSAALDAQKHGPRVISPAQGCDMELSLIQQTLPHEKGSMSELDGLNLNIALPAKHSGRLPVFVFFHGGGFSIGSGSWPQYDPVRTVQLSIEQQEPVIGVTVNYRLGAFGFLYSQELSKMGIKANRGLLDQRAALQWLQKNIDGFGGDPEKITVVGESAGAVSCTLHLQSEKPLFKQMMAMGGSSLLMKPLPMPVAEYAYGRVLDAVNIDTSLSSEEKLKSLLEIPAETFLSSIGPDVPLLAVHDEDYIRYPSSFAQWTQQGERSQYPGMKWCDRIMVGDCQFDASIFLFAVGPRKAGIAEAFRQSLEKSLKDFPDERAKLLDTYGIATSVSDDEDMLNILRFGTDIGFYAPAFTMAKAMSRRAFLYHFNEPNPWDGPFKGESTHILDVAFLFQNFIEHLGPEQQKLSKKFGSDFINFVNGKAPFDVYDDTEGGAQVYGPPVVGGAQYVQGKSPEAFGRRSFIGSLAGKTSTLDQLSIAWDTFLAGR
ncbi:carboxylesterase-like protein [Exophiala viscosa]|uniref:Carboxylic ester hydrolase n=1 Tax=Exophiala viscosa TaxID=2486360 RepID=A0AAN6IBC0_9EURO|nr:carboxylesterase-like protein [Exophiala viscosa]